MNRQGSRDISAIEERVLSQTERVAKLRADARSEADENTRNHRAAASLSSFAIVDDSLDGRRRLPRSHGGNREAEAERVERRARGDSDVERLIQDRDPCFKCGVRKDRHLEFGCRRWRG